MEEWSIGELRVGQKTTMVPFPVEYFTTTLPPPGDLGDGLHFRQHIMAFASIGIMILMYFIPRLLMRSSRYCHWLVSKKMKQYFLFASLLNLVFFAFVMLHLKNMTPLSFFNLCITIITMCLENVSSVLTDIALIMICIVVFSYRQAIVEIFGLKDHALVQADCRDWATCFSHNRFSPVEITIWKCDELPQRGGIVRNGSRPLFLQVAGGKWNEWQNTRVKECESTLIVKEKLTFNYDPYDHQFKVTLGVKRQEVIGQDAASAVLPALGGAAGGILASMNLFSAIPGALAGAGLGASTAKSFGEEIARLDFNTAMVNKYVHEGEQCEELFELGPNATWDSHRWSQLEMLPHGNCYFSMRLIQDENYEQSICDLLNDRV